MPTPQISYPYPTQIAAGQDVDSLPVDGNFKHVSSQFNTHTHPVAEISDFSSQVGFVPIGGMFPIPGATSFATWAWYTDGATFWVGSYAALASACGTWHGGNASIGRIPDTAGRGIVGWGAPARGVHADVASYANTEGAALTARRPKHKTSVTDPTHRHMERQKQSGGNPGGAFQSTEHIYLTSGGDYTEYASTGITAGVQADTPTDTPAYLVCPFLIRAI